jgi:hypothetical protein
MPAHAATTSGGSLYLEVAGDLVRDGAEELLAVGLGVGAVDGAALRGVADAAGHAADYVHRMVQRLGVLTLAAALGLLAPRARGRGDDAVMRNTDFGGLCSRWKGGGDRGSLLTVKKIR